MKFSAIALVMFAAFQWGLAGGLGSLLIDRDWDPETMSFWRALIGLACMVLWLGVMRLRGRRMTLNRRLVLWSLVAGLGVAGNFAFYFISISEGSVAVAATLMYSAPIFVYLVSFISGAERPTPVKLAAVALVMAGIVLLTGIYRAEAGAITLLGLVSGLLAGLSYALFIFGFKYAGAHGPTPSVLAIAFAAGALVLLPCSSSGVNSISPASQRSYLLSAETRVRSNWAMAWTTRVESMGVPKAQPGLPVPAKHLTAIGVL